MSQTRDRKNLRTPFLLQFPFCSCSLRRQTFAINILLTNRRIVTKHDSCAFNLTFPAIIRSVSMLSGYPFKHGRVHVGSCDVLIHTSVLSLAAETGCVQPSSSLHWRPVHGMHRCSRSVSETMHTVYSGWPFHQFMCLCGINHQQYTARLLDLLRKLSSFHFFSLE